MTTSADILRDAAKFIGANGANLATGRWVGVREENAADETTTCRMTFHDEKPNCACSIGAIGYTTTDWTDGFGGMVYSLPSDLRDPVHEALRILGKELVAQSKPLSVHAERIRISLQEGLPDQLQESIVSFNDIHFEETRAAWRVIYDRFVTNSEGATTT